MSKSFKSNRSHSNASMVLFGITGTGKSSTINHLLGFHVCKHAEDKSCTRIVDEQIITIDESSASEYLHSGKLSIIDTPGFFDTKHSSKTPQDDWNMDAMRDFFSNDHALHPTGQTFKKLYHSIIAIVHKSDGKNEFMSERFKQSIDKVIALKVVDQDRPNVIGILTHALNVRPVINPSTEWTENINKIKESYKNVLETQFGFDVPVCVIENHLNDGIAEGGLVKCGRNTRLPNEEIQPENLISVIKKKLLVNRDLLAKEIFSMSFRGFRKGISMSGEFQGNVNGPVRRGRQIEVKRSTKKHDYEANIIFIGDSGAGKTSMIDRFINGDFQNMEATIHDFKTVKIEIDGQIVRLNIYDTAGQEKFKSITRSYYRIANGVFFVYDITSQGSFNNAKNNWFDDVKKHESEGVVKMLIGTKLDMGRVVKKSDAMKFAGSHNMEFFETSSKTSENINNAFHKMAQTLLDRSIRRPPQRASSDRIKIQSKPSDKSSESKKTWWCNML